MATKSTKRQNIGNEAESRGSAYQVFSSTFLALRMLLYDEYQSVRQNGEGPIDDIQAKDTKGNNNYFQCKTTRSSSKAEIIAILTDFYRQYLDDLKSSCNVNKYVLFSLYNPPNLSRVLELVNVQPQESQSHDDYIQSKLSKTDNSLYNEAYRELLTIKSKFEKNSLKQTGTSTPQTSSITEKDSLSKDEYIDFLKYVEIWSYPFRAIKDDLYKELENAKYPRYAYHILNTTLLYEWLSRDIKKRDIEDLFTSFGIEVLTVDTESTKPSTKRKEYVVTKAKFILFKVNEKFYKKLQFLLELIIANDFPKSTKELIVEALIEDNTLSWHFLKNLDKPEWFPKIKDNVIKSIVDLEEDSAVKFQLLSYFERCADKYADEIVPLIVQVEKNTQNYNILSSLVKTLGKLKPKQKKSVKLLWELFTKLTEHQHPWVRREIPQALLPFIDYDINKVLEILEKVFFYNPPPQDVTQGSPTLALTFQGRDNENWVFEEAVKALSELLGNPEFAEKAHALAIEVEKQALQEDKKLHDSEQGIILDYSSIWLSDKSFDSERLEYNHDRKERVALEIEKALNELTPTNSKIVSNILSKLINERYEAFYLIVIKVLIRNIKTYIQLAESLVFDTKLWLVYNVRNYFLQTLITNYFQTNNGANLSKFVTAIDQIRLDDPKKTLYTKQDLYISIPEGKRDKEIDKKLAEVSDALKIKPEISKPFAVTTWSGPRPDITVEELEKKNVDELIQIMIDSSTGKRAGAWDLRGTFAGLIDKKPEKLKELLSKMKNKKLEPAFAGEMVSTYIKNNPKNISDITDLISQLSPNDSWARIDIARYLNDICRKKEVQDYNQSTLKKIKSALFILSKDKHPETDETIKSNNPRPDDAITRGINSVRGIATEAFVAFSHYFPNDKELAKRLEELADDKTNAVRATLIYNLRYLIGKNYQLCEKVISKFKNRRDPEIDFALIHFFAQLDCDKFIGEKDFIKSLFNNTNERINENLGELIGYKYVSCCDIQDLVDEIIGGRKGTKNTLRSLAFVFESQLIGLIGNDKATSVAGYLKKLLGPQNEFEVAERASFIFERDEIKPEHFGFLDESGLMEELIGNKRNIPAQMHLVKYLSKCIVADVSIERCLELLHKQVTKVEFLLSDHLIAQKISEIVSRSIDRKLSEESKNYLVDIFDAGLERGWDEFYEIYKSHKKLTSLLQAKRG